MVFFYSTKAVVVKSFDITITCPACQVTGITRLEIFSEHLDIFWVPFVPTDKLAMSKCSNCGQRYTTKYLDGMRYFNEHGLPVIPVMPMELSKYFYSIKKKVLPKWWQFLGVAMVLLSIAYAFLISERGAAKKTATYFGDPKTGDVYQAEMDEKVYTTFKIQQLSPDSVSVVFNKYTVDDPSAFYKLEHEPFEVHRVTISRSFLKKLKDADKIHRIIRE